VLQTTVQAVIFLTINKPEANDSRRGIRQLGREQKQTELAILDFAAAFPQANADADPGRQAYSIFASI
jgi:hypothetical protein